MEKYSISITTSMGDVHDVDRVIEVYVADTIATLLGALHIDPRYCIYPDIVKIEIERIVVCVSVPTKSHHTFMLHM